MKLDAKNKLDGNQEKIWSQLDQNLALYKEGLEKANEKRLGNDKEKNNKDKSNKETLETMSSMA